MVYDTLNPKITQIILGDAREGLRVLDVGCGTGRLGAQLKSRKALWLTGIEIDAQAAQSARQSYDEVLTVDLDKSLDGNAAAARFERGFDIIVFGDILEHVRSPEKLLAGFGDLLNDGGYIIASIPNVTNWMIRFGVLFGRFDYNGGILDPGHLRFFTYATARRLLEENGYTVVSVTNNNHTRLMSVLGRLWMSMFAFQFVFKCVRSR